MVDLLFKKEEVETDENTIDIGCSVELEDKTNQDFLNLTLVNEGEEDVLEGRITIKSPVGRELLGKTRGDIIEVVTDKPRRYKIIDWE